MQPLEQLLDCRRSATREDFYITVRHIDCVSRELQFSSDVSRAGAKKYALHAATHFKLAAHYADTRGVGDVRLDRRLLHFPQAPGLPEPCLWRAAHRDAQDCKNAPRVSFVRLQDMPQRH